MNNLISPYDLGDSQIVERTQRVNINTLVRQAQKGLKLRLLEAQIGVLGIVVNLTSSKTRFSGQRIWFVCPLCEKRVGVIYKAQQLLGCRYCLNLKYKNQRFKGMIETNIPLKRENIFDVYS